MIDPELEATLNKALDQDLSPEEEAALRLRLSRDPEARAYYEDLLRLRDALAAVPAVNPPEKLKMRVLEAVEKIDRRTTPSVDAAANPPWFRALPTLFSRRHRVGYGVAFALGVAVGLIILVARPDSESTKIDPRAFSGTMTSQLRPEDPSLTEKQEIAGPGVRGELATRVGSHILSIDLALSTEQEAEVLIQFNPTMLLLRGFEQTATSVREVLIRPGLLRVFHSGSNQYRFLLGRTGTQSPELEVIVKSGDVVLRRRVSGVTGGL